MTLVNLVQSEPKTYKLAGVTRLRFEGELQDGPARQQYLEQLLETFATDAREDAA